LTRNPATACHHVPPTDFPGVENSAARNRPEQLSGSGGRLWVLTPAVILIIYA